MGVSEIGGTPKSSILIGFSIINHPFWGTPIFGNTHMAKLFLILARGQPGESPDSSILLRELGHLDGVCQRRKHPEKSMHFVGGMCSQKQWLYWKLNLFNFEKNGVRPELVVFQQGSGKTSESPICFSWFPNHLCGTVIGIFFVSPPRFCANPTYAWSVGDYSHVVKIWGDLT